MGERPFNLPAYGKISEPDLLFAEGKTDKHPLRGLLRSGPYSKNFGLLPQVKLAYVAPKSTLKKLDRLFEELQHRAEPREAQNYYPTYEGFEKVFRTSLVSPADGIRVEMSEKCAGLARERNGPLLINEILQ